MTSPDRRRRTAAVGLVASLAGLPVLLVAAAGPPAVGGLPSWGWVADGLRDQYLPVEPLLAALGLFAWALWAYAVLVTILRVVAVAAARRGIARLGGAAVVQQPGHPGAASVPGRCRGRGQPAGLGPARGRRTGDPRQPPGGGPHAWMAPAGWDRAPSVAGRRPPLHRRHPTWWTNPTAGAASQRLSQPRSTAPNARPARAGCIRWRRAIRCGGSPNASWVTATAGRRSSPLNQGRRMGDGQLLRDGGLIMAGWQLLLPPPDPRRRRGTCAGSRPALRPATAPGTADASTTGTVDHGAGPRSAARPGRNPDDGHHDRRRDIVELPSGSMVGCRLAVGIAAALAVAGLRRRRRRRPLWPPAPAQHGAWTGR